MEMFLKWPPGLLMDLDNQDDAQVLIPYEYQASSPRRQGGDHLQV